MLGGAVLAGCAGSYHEQKVRDTATRASECPVHHIKLSKLTGFAPASNTHIFFISLYIELENKHEKDLPYHIRGEFNRRRTEICTQRVTIDYCPVCQKKWEDVLERHGL
jgi:hypothetical protein